MVAAKVSAIPLNTLSVFRGKLQLSRQCLDQRIESQDELLKQLEPWQTARNDRAIGVKWRFTTADARIKLRRLYPAIQYG